MIVEWPHEGLSGFRILSSRDEERGERVPALVERDRLEQPRLALLVLGCLALAGVRLTLGPIHPVPRRRCDERIDRGPPEHEVGAVRLVAILWASR